MSSKCGSCWRRSGPGWRRGCGGWGCGAPMMVDAQMRAGKLEVSVLHSADRWFGMTYQQDRETVAAELRRLGMRVIPGEANYLLFASPRELSAPLAERGILLRRCGNFEGLDDSWYRAAVRTHEENQRLVEALEEVLR